MMERPTIDALMCDAGVTSFPERWREFYDAVMADYEQNGCALATAAYYDELEAEYGLIGEHLPVFREAAEAIAARDALARYLALLCHALTERERITSDLATLTFPKDEENSLAVRMLPSLAMMQGMRYADGVMKEKGMPEDVRLRALRSLLGCVNGYRIRHNGEYGCFSFGWFQLAYDAKLHVIGSLQIEMDFSSLDFFRAYENKEGKIVALANGFPVHRSGFPLGSFRFEDGEGSFVAEFTETSDAYIGYPYDEKGYICKEKITLSKSEWHEKLMPGDPVVNLHIPSGVPFTPEALDETDRKIRAFLAKYYPEYKYKAFYCGSWLLDPQLGDLLGADSNIARFGRRFTPVIAKNDGYSVFRFAFLMPDNNFTFEELPEKTRLQRAIKKHYLDGKAIYGVNGFYF